MESLPETISPEHAVDWDELLVFIEDRRVIPIVGKELLRLPGAGQGVLLEHVLAARVAEAFDLPTDGLPTDYGLNEMVLHLGQSRRRRSLYPQILSFVRDLMQQQPLPMPEPLRQLAAITDFTLFVSTTFDPLLKKAIDAVRFQGDDRTPSLAYSLHREVKDLPYDADDLPEPYVYQIFGEVSSIAGDYAVTEEDTLEFLHQLQTQRRPPKLFDAFRENHLLFLGCGYRDWLARFFIRTMVNERLIGGRATSEVIADLESHENSHLRLFLEGCQVYLFPSGDVVEFVKILHQRWTDRHPASGAEAPPPGAATVDRMEPGAIFISYASQDRQAAEAMKEALERYGLEVWFDKKDLEPGDDWRYTIKHNIRQCSLFLPLLSRRTQARLEGVFREEWTWAIERGRGIAPSVPFIQPVVVDDLREGVREIPEAFWAKQCSRFPGGRPTEDFLQHAKEAVRTLRLAGR